MTVRTVPDAIYTVGLGLVAPAMLYLLGRLYLSGYLANYNIFVSEMGFDLFDIMSFSFNVLDNYKIVSGGVLIALIYWLTVFATDRLDIKDLSIGVKLVAVFASMLILWCVSNESYATGVRRGAESFGSLVLAFPVLNARSEKVWPGFGKCLEDQRAFRVVSSSEKVAIFCRSVRYNNRGVSFIIDKSGLTRSFRMVP